MKISFGRFLLLAREKCIDISVSMYSDDRPATDDRPLIWKISNGDISAKGHPIYSIFGSSVGFSGSADRMALFPVRTNPRWRPSLTEFTRNAGENNARRVIRLVTI